VLVTSVYLSLKGILEYILVIAVFRRAAHWFLMLPYRDIHFLFLLGRLYAISVSQPHVEKLEVSRTVLNS